MESESVLDQVRSGHQPSEWNVWPLRRDYVRTSALKWGLLAIIGFVMLIPVSFSVIPSDFIGTPFYEQLLALGLLVLLGALAFGSLGIALHDVWRLSRAGDFWLVITPETFVKAEPGHVIETPLEHVANLTLKGVRLPSEDGNSQNGAPISQFLIAGRLVNFANMAGLPGVSRERTRGNASLAYRDARDNKVITVCTDDSYDHMAAIYQLLRDRAATREDKVWRTSFKASRR
jgi:hypothetical protein